MVIPVGLRKLNALNLNPTVLCPDAEAVAVTETIGTDRQAHVVRLQPSRVRAGGRSAMGRHEEATRVADPALRDHASRILQSNLGTLIGICGQVVATVYNMVT